MSPPEISHADALTRMKDAEATLRAIGAGEVDAFVMADGRADGGTDRRVFTLSTADRPHRMFVENMRDGAATVSPKGLVLYANERLAELVQRPRQTIVGTHLETLVAGEASAGIAERLGRQPLTVGHELELLDATGRTVPVLVRSFPLVMDDETLTCLTFTDLTAQKAQDREIARLGDVQRERLIDLQTAQAALTKQATHDALTGLPQRALLMDRINRALLRAQRSGARTGVYFVDLDRFKQVNDTRGHDAGDLLLQQVAARLQSVMRPMDMVARVGGDEFVIVAPDLHNQFDAFDIGKRIIDELCGRRGPDEIAGRINASVGIAISVAGSRSAESLLKDADTAMYHAKSRGGACVEVFDEALGREVERRSSARRTLEAALQDDRVVVHYQPIYDLQTVAPTGVEALARITDVDGSLVVPAAFIPAAEDSGLILPLDRRVLELACGAAEGWRRRDLQHADPSVAVNLSARQFERGDLADIVAMNLELTGLPASQLHLELTETAILDLRPELISQLEQLTELGVEIGLDDFGTGYASLTHLRQLPLAFVKIDQTFVQGLELDPCDEQIVAAVIDLAANLGLRSIAEGVETPEQLERLRAMGCDQAQGYLFDRPLTERDAARSLADHHPGPGGPLSERRPGVERTATPAVSP